MNGALGAAGGYVASGPVTLQYNTEPINDGDTNSYTNYSIDFGFYKLEIGNVVWIDLNNDGNKGNGEPIAPNVKVELLDIAGAVISTTATDSDGVYTFTNLVSGTYQVQVTPLAGYRSSTGQDTGAAIDDNDNGRPSTTNPALIVSEPFSLTASLEPVVTTANGTSRNPTIDFGLYRPLVNLGNQVWFDTNANGLIDGVEVGVPGVTVTLYVDTNNDGSYTIGIDTYVSTTTTTIVGGFYTFTRLPEGDYLVVLPASNFVAGGPLHGYKSSDVDNATPNDDTNSDDNGILTISGDVASRAISLTVGSEPSQTIAAGDSNWTVDFGFYKLTLGNVVWEDYNNDGIHNAGEPGIAGVSVTLYDVTGTTSISQTTTDANGAYTFTNLYSGTYVVGVMPPTVANGAPYQSSLGIGGEADPEGNVDDTSASVSDNGVNVQGTGEIRSNPITMTAGAEPTVVNATGSTTNPTLDFGLFRPASLGDYVWFDQNRDGLQNEATPNGMNGVTVTLYYNGVPSLTQVTANDGSGNPGYYNFTGLVSGTYTVAFTLPANYTWTQHTGTLTDTLNSDVNALGVTAPAVVMPGTSNPYVDAGLKLWPVSLGNRVWIDSNNNGQVDLGEQNVPSVTVQLYLDSDGNGAYNAGDTLVSSTVTSASGYYTFTDLVPSDGVDPKTHYLVVIPASNFATGAPLAGLLNSTPTTAPSKLASDNDKDHGMTVGGVVASGPIQLTQNDEPTGEPNEGNDPTIDQNSNQTIDFGFYKPNAAIGNYVWLDEDADGQQDAGEPGIPNAVVQMTDGAGKTYLTTTDANGQYLFPNLPAGTYTVKVLPSNFSVNNPLEGLAQTPLNPNGGADFGNQDQNGYAITVADGETNLSGDFGYIRNPSDVNGNTGLAALGDRVWIDSDGDGKQDPDEVPVSGVVLTLFGPGPDGLFHTSDDVPLGTQTTDANGNYLFADLPAGAYQVEVTSDSTASHKILGADYAQTGDPDHFGTSGTANDNITSTPIILGPGDVFLNADFGYQPKGSASLGAIGDTVWFDANASGTSTPDAGEYGIPNVSVALIKDLDGDGVWDAGEPIIATDVTDANGQYLFTDLPLSDDSVDGDADYIVWVNDVNHALADLRQTYDEDAPLDNMSHTALSSGVTQDLNQDFSYTPVNQWPGLGAIGDTVWFDANNSGSATPDVGEHGIQGVLVVLNDAHGNAVTTTTDSNGHYYFGGLPLKETYTVTVAAENFLAGGVLEGMRETYDQDAPMTDNQSVTTLTVGAPIDLNQDFSYVGGASESTLGRIGNLVWMDTNTDGHFDGVNGPDGLAGTDDDEPIMAGVTVDLYLDLNGNGKVDAGEPMLASTVTVGTLGQGTNGVDGNYIFEGLPTSATGIDYVVVVSDRAGVLNGYWKSDGPDDGANNNSQANEYDITLTTTAHEDLTADFGYYLEPAALGNYVWYDKNKDGKQDANEPPIVDVEVTLVITYPNGTVTTLKTTTDVNGHYEFQNLLLDEDYGDEVGDPQFMISVANPTGYLPTTVGVGDPKTDSNLHSGTPAIPAKGHTDVSAELSPLDEQTIASYDFGFWKPAQLGNYVWVDSNKDGIQNEPAANGVNGITATLYVSDAINGWSVLSTTLTGNDVNGNPGYYTFSYLISGTYYVKFDVPLGYTVTVPTPGTANGNDADLSGQTAPVDLPSETSNPDIDMGLWVPPLSLGNQVWKDVNNNGIVDAGEVGVAGATVDLYKDTNRDGKYTPGVDVKVATSTTVAGGYYTFTNLIPGDYLVVLPASNFVSGGVLVGYRSSDPTSATPNNNVDNDDNGAPNARGDVASNVITLFPFTEPTSDGDSDTNTNWTVDFGVWLPAGLGDRVWKDNNGNGVQDPGEPGVPDVMVTLQTVTGTLTTKTDVNGNYVFTGLLPGTYTVTFGLPTGFSFTTPDVGSNDANDSDANRATGAAQPVTLNPGDNNLTIDAGIIQPATLGNYVWVDVNQDGLQGPDEIAVPGVTVTLYANGQVVSTTVTDAKGQYQFVNLIPGVSYTLNFQLPTGFAFTLPNVVGPDGDNKDSDADPNGNTAPIVLGPGENNTSVDAGIRSALVLEKAAVGSGLNNTIGTDGLITYTVKVTNIGTTPAANVVISDPLTVDTEYVIGSGVPTPSSVQPVVWTIASIGPGASQTIRFTVKVLATDDSTKPITNTIYLKNRSNIVAPDAFVATAKAPITRGPTAVTLARFEVTKVDGQVNVMWQTSLEQDTYGFNLYRAESDDRASAVKVTRELIVSNGRNGGASYAFVDADANVGKRYAYWLQETELSGRINEYGPALFGTAKAAVLTNVLADVLVLPGGVPVSGVSLEQVAEARAELPQAVINGTAARELTAQTVGIQPVVIAQAGVAVDIAVVKPAAAAAQTDVTQPAAALSIPVAKPAAETLAVVEASTAAQAVEATASRPAVRTLSGVNTAQTRGLTKNLSASGLPSVPSAGVEESNNALPVWVWLMAGLLALTLGVVTGTVVMRRKRDR